MSGKYFVKKNGVNVDLTELFEPNGTNNNTYYPDLDISNTAKGYGVAYARPDDFGYKIKHANGTITDLSEYCVINPEYFPDSTNVNVSTYNSMSGYIVGGSGGGGGGSGGVYDNTWGSDDHSGGPGGAGGGGEVKWFADISLQGVNNINIAVGNGGNGGSGGASKETSGGWASAGSGGNKGNDSVIYKGNTQNNNNKLVSAEGGGGGGGGNRVSTGGSGGTGGASGTCVHNANNSITHKEHDKTWEFTTTNWNSSYSFLNIPTGTKGGNGGAAGYGGTPNSGGGGEDTNDGEKGYAVLYLKR